MLQEIQEKVNQKSSSEAVVKIEQRLLCATGLPQISDKLELGTPSPRAGHSLTLISSRIFDKNLDVEEGNRNSKNVVDSSTEKEDDIFVLFGGANHEQGFLDDLFILKQIQPELKWHQIKLFSSPSGPAARYEHAALSIRRKIVDSSIICNELMIMFGAGIDGPLSDCWVYNIDESKWTELETKGSKPCPRVLKSVAYIESLNRVYLFGGGQQNNVPISDSNTYCLDIDSLRWFMVSGDRSLHPSKRLGHSLTVIGKKIYLFGGLCNNDILSDLWVFDTDSNRWSEIKDSNGSLPNGRCAHSGVALGKKIIILGGMSPDPPSVLESTYIFDTETLNWTHTSLEEFRRLDHSCTAINNNQMLLFGGMDLKNVFQDANLVTLYN